MDQKQLDKIKERESKATGGLWYSIESQFVLDPEGGGVCQTYDCDGEDYPNYENNLDFIAHAREDVPALIAEVERLQKEVDRLEAKELNAYLDKELEIERLQAEVEHLQASLQQQMIFDGHSEQCAAARGASGECGCGASGTIYLAIKTYQGLISKRVKVEEEK